MIFAKISPAASVARQNGPFSSETVTADYMAAFARPYVLGGKEVRFEIQYGTLEFNEEGKAVEFRQVLSDSVVLTEAELADWGTDDAVILEKLAVKQGTSVVETVSSDIHRFR